MRQGKIETLFEGQHLRLQRRGHWEFVSRTRGTGVVAVIAVTENHELVLTEQFRPAVQKKVVDLPAGLAGDISGEEKEPFAHAAARELIEETGFAGQSLAYVFSGPTSAGIASEMIDVYLCFDVVQVAHGGGDESEDIRVHAVPLQKIGPWLKRKETSRTCVDPKVYAALGVLALNSKAEFGPFQMS